MHILHPSLHADCMYSIRAQDGDRPDRPCKIVLLTLVAPRGVTALHLSWGITIEHARTAYHKTCGTEYQQRYRWKALDTSERKAATWSTRWPQASSEGRTDRPCVEEKRLQGTHFPNHLGDHSGSHLTPCASVPTCSEGSPGYWGKAGSKRNTSTNDVEVEHWRGVGYRSTKRGSRKLETSGGERGIRAVSEW